MHSSPIFYFFTHFGDLNISFHSPGMLGLWSGDVLWHGKWQTKRILYVLTSVCGRQSTVGHHLMGWGRAVGIKPLVEPGLRVAWKEWVSCSSNFWRAVPTLPQRVKCVWNGHQLTQRAIRSSGCLRAALMGLWSSCLLHFSCAAHWPFSFLSADPESGSLTDLTNYHPCYGAQNLHLATSGHGQMFKWEHRQSKAPCAKMDTTLLLYTSQPFPVRHGCASGLWGDDTACHFRERGEKPRAASILSPCLNSQRHSTFARHAEWQPWAESPSNHHHCSLQWICNVFRKRTFGSSGLFGYRNITSALLPNTSWNPNPFPDWENFCSLHPKV